MSINTEHFAAIINSRQSKFPCGNDLWVKNTVAAVQDAVKNRYTILSSIGMNTYELVMWSANYFGGRQLVIYPISSLESAYSAADKTIAEFELDIDRTDFKFILASNKNTRANWHKRDETIISLADRIYPISIRKNSTLLPLFSMKTESDFVKKFKTLYKKRKIPKYDIDFNAVERQYPPSGWKYLTHWTHSHSGKWVGGKKARYYEMLVSSGDENPHSARRTLERIEQTERISASSTMIRGDIPVVSFTELPPAEALKLMRWRTGLGRYNFEPFGVAVDKHLAGSIGAKPVIYGNDEVYKKLSKSERAFYQPNGNGKKWHEECEWRYIGDFNLKKLSRDKYFFIKLG